MLNALRRGEPDGWPSGLRQRSRAGGGRQSAGDDAEGVKATSGDSPIEYRAASPHGRERLGWVAEWFKAAVLKTAVGASSPWVRIPPLPPPRAGKRLITNPSQGGTVNTSSSTSHHN